MGDHPADFGGTARAGGDLGPDVADVAVRIAGGIDACAEHLAKGRFAKLSLVDDQE